MATDTQNTQRVRVLLVTKYPAKYIEDTIAPGLRDIGADVVDTVSTDYKGKIEGVDAVLFMFQMCGHDEYRTFKNRTKAAGIRFLTITRQSSEWVAAFRLAGVRLPVLRSGDLQAAPPPTFTPVVATSPPAPRYRTFGAALRAVRSSEEVTPAFVADLCDVTVADLEAWEADRTPIDVDAYDKLTELFVSLMDAPSPNIMRKSLPRPAPPPSPIPAPPLSMRTPEPAAPTTAPPTSSVEIKPSPASAPEVPHVPAPPAPKQNGHTLLSPLTGLLRAARALKLKDDIIVSVTDAGVVVTLGAETWPGSTDEEAIGAARRSMDERLRALLQQVTEARQLLGLTVE